MTSVWDQPPTDDEWAAARKSTLEASDVPLKGGIDLVMRREGILRIKDWKSKGNIKSYLQRNLDEGFGEPGEWLKNPEHPDGRQMITYAEWARRNLPDVTEVRVDHVALQTKGGKRAAEYGADLTAAEIEDAWGLISSKYIAPIIQTAKAERAEDVGPTRSYCYAYHKQCAFANVCPEGSSNFFQTMFNTDPPPKELSTMGILDQLAALDAKPAPPPVSVSATTNSDVVTPDLIKQAVDTTIEVLNEQNESRVHLYFVGAPLGIATKTLGEYVQALNDTALTTLGEKVPDVRLSKHQALGFGAWKATLQQLSKDNPLPGGHYVIRPGDDRTEAVADAVALRAYLVVR